MKKNFARLMIFLLILAVGFVYWADRQIDTFLFTKVNIEEPTLVTVPDGVNYHYFIRQLVADGYIAASPWARWAVKIHPQLSKLKAGTYQIDPSMTLFALFNLVASGKEHQFSLTFIEGTRFKDWREQLRASKNVGQSIETMSEADIAKALGLEYSVLDGLLLPETYYYVAGESDMSILKRASLKLQTLLDKAWKERDQTIPLRSEYELLTLASIIEKETSMKAERVKVASVFVNRLNKGMRLQTDPTVIYGMGEAYQGRIRKKDLRALTPYNTYVIYGLPPSPIAMSSKASILAAAAPAETPYFYFVADGRGGHQFSTTLAEHNRAVKQYLKMLKNK